MPDLADRLRERFDDVFVALGETTITVARETLVETIGVLREGFGLDYLADLSSTDWPGRDPRIWLAYHLGSTETRERVRVKVGLSESDLSAPTVTTEFPTASFHEREVYDFFGVTFEGHPDLRRILMPDEWEGHPGRKDHPLGGVRTQYKGAFIPPPDERGL